jgi:hypothetical protein
MTRDCERANTVGLCTVLVICAQAFLRSWSTPVIGLWRDGGLGGRVGFSSMRACIMDVAAVMICLRCAK